MNDVIQRFNRGHQAAFTLLYERYWPSIFYFIRKFVSDTGQAEDIAAETFIKLWNRRENFDNEKSISNFLHITARNSSIDWLRSEKRDVRNREELLFLLQQEQYEILQDDIKAEVLREIKLEIDKLPKKIREVFILAYMEGKSNDEIATLLKIKNQSVRNHKTRALTLIRLAITGKNWLYFLLALWYRKF
jgi:RNA polymerase sigma-70 factor (family 1)